jgi:hypothetical protein
MFTAKVNKGTEAQFALDGHGAYQFFHFLGVTVTRGGGAAGRGARRGIPGVFKYAGHYV